MFKRNEFMAILALKSLSIAEIAKVLSLSPVTLYRKMNGESDFYRNEIEIIRKFLKLSDEEVFKIFFAN